MRRDHKSEPDALSFMPMNSRYREALSSRGVAGVVRVGVAGASWWPSKRDEGNAWDKHTPSGDQGGQPVGAPRHVGERAGYGLGAVAEVVLAVGALRHVGERDGVVLGLAWSALCGGCHRSPWSRYWRATCRARWVARQRLGERSCGISLRRVPWCRLFVSGASPRADGTRVGRA